MVVVAVDVLEEYVCGLEAAGAFVGYAPVVASEVIDSTVVTGRCSATLAGWLSEVTALTTQS